MLYKTDKLLGKLDHGEHEKVDKKHILGWKLLHQLRVELVRVHVPRRLPRAALLARATIHVDQGVVLRRLKERQGLRQVLLEQSERRRAGRSLPRKAGLEMHDGLLAGIRQGFERRPDRPDKLHQRALMLFLLL